MTNTKSAEKALRSSRSKKANNLFWKRRIKAAVKEMKGMLGDKEGDILNLKGKSAALQKILDKAAKNKVIHKNKARRLKSRFAKRISAHEQQSKQVNSRSS